METIRTGTRVELIDLLPIQKRSDEVAAKCNQAWRTVGVYPDMWVGQLGTVVRMLEGGLFEVKFDRSYQVICNVDMVKII